ncbi:cysteine hydrolase [Yoonia sp. F2084L]|uniref:cysteine hydrolase family protein n=1 Tax=Yoonia sp. F2084L TaxID=2926419 RepID=UPI001FF2FE54|nr:isochorismatase family cysteine hydrolase [Yoonia sp. F2084L]MCK0097730.1 cysteine hydrolase [Yoonia sp. F2084L]
MIWTIPALALLGIFVWFANGIRKIGAVSVDEPIEARSETALLLIDLQTAFWDAGTFSDTAKVEAKERIVAEVKQAKAAGMPVIGVRHEWSIPSTKAVAKLLGKGLAIEGTAGTELIAPLDDLADHTVVKRVQDAFETRELDGLLKQLAVGKLRIVGLDMNYCVAKTALAARQRGYEVEIIKQGVLTANQQMSEKTIDLLKRKQVTLH